MNRYKKIHQKEQEEERDKSTRGGGVKKKWERGQIQDKAWGDAVGWLDLGGKREGWQWKWEEEREKKLGGREAEEG